MECAVRADVLEGWISNDLRSVSSDPSPSGLCSTLCRRASSFPVVNGHKPIASSLRNRSKSESDALNRFGLALSRNAITEQLKKRQFLPRIPSKLAENSASDGQSDMGSDCNSEDKDDETSIANHINLVENEARTTIVKQKSVRFADDCGKELATVKVITEPSDYPPAISASVIRRLLGKPYDENEDELNNKSASWMISFKQPASEYVKFREKLENECVALENVMLRNEISHMIGTVKVKNITFAKKVFVRFTSDGWKSYLDKEATYQPTSSKFYDTFSFDIELPTNSDPDTRIEFCICFEAGATEDDSKPVERWDSNEGCNYILKSKEAVEETRHVPLLFGRQDLNDAYTSDYENWTRFAAWKNLSTEGPYW